MRRLVAGLTGLLLTAAFVLAAGRGVGLTFGPSTGLAAAARTPGLAWLLVAGVSLARLVLSRRISPIPPLVAGVLLLVGTLVGLSAPNALVPDEPGGAAFGMYVLNGYGLGVLFSALLLVVAAAPSGRRTSSD